MQQNQGIASPGGRPSWPKTARMGVLEECEEGGRPDGRSKPLRRAGPAACYFLAAAARIDGERILRQRKQRNMTALLFDFISRYVSLTDDEKNAILSLDISRSAKKGTILLKEGQKSKESYFVLKGCLRAYYVVDAEEKTTAFYTEAEVLTPHCAIAGTPSEYYVSCVEDTLLIVSNSDMEAEMNGKFPKFETLCRILAEERLAKQQLDFDQFKTSSPERRYLTLIEQRPDLVQRVSQHHLASYLGVTPQSLSRLRARISRKKNLA
jgi:CRP-like cAMP-binding protein